MKKTGLYRYRAVVLISVLTLLAFTGCPAPYGILTEARTFSIDLKSSIINATAAAVPGLGVSEIELTVVTMNGTEEVETTRTVSAADISAWPGNYGRVDLPIEGKLIRVTAAAGDFSTVIDNWKDTSSITGWTSFANITKLKLDYITNPVTPESSTFRFLVCPRGGDLELFVDTGVVPLENRNTDRTTASGQAAFQIQWAENPAGLTCDVYYAVVPENLSVVYNEATNTGAYYDQNPWTDSWSYEEITSKGRQVGRKVWKLEKYNDNPIDAANPMGDGLTSYLVNLNGLSLPGLTDQYLLLGIVLHAGDLSVPLDVHCIDIQ